jgi:C_GCAxxG_C_C family probable redox protein
MSEAVNRFKQGLNCSQAVFSANCRKYGIDEKQAAAIGAGFGAGMGRLGKTCGAVTGAIMILGLENYTDIASKKKVHMAVQKFISEFEKVHGTVECLKLIGMDLTTDEANQKAMELGLFATRCRHFVETADKILNEMLQK